MELVYLWVEDYKNIHKQGFNFSPRFECKYNPDDNNLTICDKKKNECKDNDYIENFFGENINVTAIVGKNGSGKSNILKSLFQNDDNPSSKEKLWYILYTDKLYFYNVDDVGIHEKEINLNQKYDIEKLKKDSKTIENKLDFSMIYFSNILQYLPVYDDKQNKSFYNISTSYLINKYNKNSFANLKYQYSYYKSKVIMQTLSMLSNAEFQINFDLPIELNIVTKGSYDSSDNYEKMKKLLKDGTETKTFYSRVKFNIIYNYLFNYLENNQLQEELGKNKRTIDEFYKYIKTKIALSDELDKLLIKFENTEFILTSIKIKDVDEELIKCFEIFHEIQAFPLDVLDVLQYNWKPELSSGQENLLFQFATFYNTIKNATNLKNDIIILIDEGETTMHPQWQKEYIQQYIEFLKLNFKDKKIHIILTTHSPFLLSDIPKQNTIFLDKDENGNCIVVDGLKEKKQTFGANIHTLLSDSFFMEDGLMGEFAKSKIDKAIKLLNQDKLDEKDLKYCEQIISIIGEPIVKNQLQRMLDSKRLKKIDIINQKIKDMSYELEILKEHQSKIVQDELRDRGKKQYRKRFEDD